MSHFLLTWGVGSGLGHLTKLEPIARSLLTQGHEVSLIAKNIPDAGLVFRGLDLPILPAPTLQVRLPHQLPQMDTFPEGLFNCGFGDPEVLGALGRSWRDLLSLMAPDLLLAEHSPVALLAARGLGLRRAVIGRGIYCPPDRSPLSALTPEGPIPASEAQAAVEQEVLRNANRVNDRFGWPRLARISQLYNDVEEVYLATFPELDHYAPREAGTYCGVWGRGPGVAAPWPEGNRPRAFAYLRPDHGLREVLQSLTLRGIHTALFAPHLEASLAEKIHRLPNVGLAAGAMDLGALGEADFCVNNGTGAMVAQTLLAGKPQLMVPLNLQHACTARQVEGLGAGLVMDTSHPERIPAQVDQLLTEPRFRLAAEAFADRYTALDEEECVRRIVAHLTGLSRGARPRVAAGSA